MITADEKVVNPNSFEEKHEVVQHKYPANFPEVEGWSPLDPYMVALLENVQHVGGHVNDTPKHLGTLFHKAGKCISAEDSFSRAMNRRI